MLQRALPIANRSHPCTDMAATLDQRQGGGDGSGSAPGEEQPERHLQQLASAGARGSETDEEAARRVIEQDLEHHFVSGGAQTTGERGWRRCSCRCGCCHCYCCCCCW